MKITDYQMSTEGVWMDVLFDEEKTNIRIQMVGTNSDQYAAFEKKAQNLYLKKGKKTKGSEIESLNNDRRVSCVIAWENMEDKDGKPIVCNYENKVSILTDREKYKWLIDQVEDFMMSDENFLARNSIKS